MQAASSETEKAAPDRVISIPRGQPVVVDGKISPKEWDDSARLEITVKPDWKIPVRFKHDDRNLYFLFDRVTNGGDRLFPELFFDPYDRKGSYWEKGRWWFHVSANLCESEGAPNVYEKNGVFQCAHEKPGWEANNPPTTETETIEIRIAFDKIGRKPSQGMRMGVAAAMTNATGNNRQVWYVWPMKATVDSPRTWGEAVLQ